MEGGLVLVLGFLRFDVVLVGDHSLMAGRNAGTPFCFRLLTFRLGGTRLRTVRRRPEVERTRFMSLFVVVGDNGVEMVEAIGLASTFDGISVYSRHAKSAMAVFSAGSERNFSRRRSVDPVVSS
jgi:hypothetical protein